MLTVVIPCSPSHEAVVERAAASCFAQTVPVSVVIVHDRDRKGAGWARNQGLAQVKTDFVTFLDADDWLEPTFAAEMLLAYDGRHYVYCDHYQDGARIDAPACAWIKGGWHVVSALVPTAWAHGVGGFDPTLDAGEDTEFYLKLCAAGYCGKRHPAALMHYSKDGERSRGFFFSPRHQEFMRLMGNRYGDKAMSCCGQTPPNDNAPAGEPEANDVLAVALWAGNRQQRGRMTGRLYPRTGNGKQVWIDPRDVDAMPNLFRRVNVDPLPPLPDAPKVLTSLEEIAEAMTPGGIVKPPKRKAGAKATKPDVKRLMELYKS